MDPRERWLLRICVGLFAAAGIVNLLIAFGIMEPGSTHGQGPPSPRWVFGAVGILFFLPSLVALTATLPDRYPFSREPSALRNFASRLGSAFIYLGVLVCLGCMAAVVDFAVYDDIIRDIPRVGPWGKVGLIIALIVFGGAALFLNIVFLVMLAIGIGMALDSLKSRRPLQLIGNSTGHDERRRRACVGSQLDRSPAASADGRTVKSAKDTLEE